jgi:hypothetical protein
MSNAVHGDFRTRAAHINRSTSQFEYKIISRLFLRSSGEQQCSHITESGRTTRTVLM